MAFLDAFRRRRPYLTPGFGGGTIFDQLDNEQPDLQQQSDLQQQPAPVIPPDQQTRPRTVNPFVNRLMQGQTRPRIADPTSFDAEHLRELESQPSGFRDKLGMVAQNVATNLGYKPLPTRRQRDIADIEGRLGRDVALDRNRIAMQQGQMVPFTLPDGTVTYVPAKTQGTLASRQQNQQQTLSMRRQQMEAHNARWETMGKHEAAQDAQRLYNSGAADDNEDLRDEIANRMGLPAGTKLPPSSQGQVTVDENGNFKLINRRTGEARPVTQDGKPVASMQATTEAGRNRRAAESQAGADRRAGMRQGRSAGTGGMTLPQKAAAEKLVSQYNEARKLEMQAVDSDFKVRQRAKREALWNRIFATYPGLYEETAPGSGELRAKAGAQAPSSGVTEQQIRDAAASKGLDPDTAVQRARKRGLIQ